MKQSKSVMWIVFFLIITASPFLAYLCLGRYVDSENYENRNKTEKPVFSVENYESFPKEFETYYNDNLPFRNQLIRFHNSIDYFLFHQSSNEDVVIGKNGWLFYCADGENAVEQSLGHGHFSQKHLREIADNLTATQRILEDKDIEFVLFIAPNKETIYKEELPDYYKVKDDYTNTDQLVDYLKENTDIRVVYPKQELLDAKKAHPDILLYQKLDTHWNDAGAYIGAKSLAKELGIEMPAIEEVLLEPEVSSGGDLASMLNIRIKDGNVDYDVSGISALETVKIKCDFETEYIYHTAGADPRRLFVRRDSFSSAMSRSLVTQFEDSLWVHQASFDQQQFFDYDADIFVIEVAERIETDLENFRIQ